MLFVDMRASTRRHLLSSRWLVAPIALTLLGACASPPPPKPKPKPAAETMEPTDEEIGDLEPEPIETGKDCTTATVECGGGVCVAHVNNQCEQPVTCRLDVMASCKAGTSTGQARTGSSATFRPKTEDKMSAAGDCADGEVVFTVAESMSCK